MVNIVVSWFICTLLGITFPDTHPISSNSINKMHPFYVSVIQIDHNAKMKTGEVSIRVFTEDLESALRNSGNTRVNLTNAAEKEKNNKLISDYVLNNLQLTIDGKKVTFHYVGYEQQLESVWSYFEINNLITMKNVSISCSLLYNYQDKQINIFHVKANGMEKSTKLNFPETQANINF